MTQEKMRKIITACVSAATVLLVFLVGFLCYQWIARAVLDNRMERLEKEIAALEQNNADLEDYAAYLETDMGKDWLAFQMGFVKGNK